MTYGFVANPELSLRHNVSNILLNMSAWLYHSRPNNIAFHNLCHPTFKLHVGLKSLLGLGLSFCPRPTFSTRKSDVQLQRFYRDCNTRMFFCGDEKPIDKSKLFIRSAWQPDIDQIPSEFRARISYFIKRIGKFFIKRKRTHANLLPSQLAAYSWIKHNDNVVIFPTDKNLGPAIMERDKYISVALNEHLTDGKTYRKLDKITADRRILTITIIIKQIITTLKSINHQHDAKFLHRSLLAVEDPFPYFYLLAKVHKTPLKTRPIVSVSGSILHGLERWVDMILQKICLDLPYRCTSSADLVTDLKKLGALPTSALLFTCDATSMYTNIETKHALRTIEEYLQERPHILRSMGLPMDLFIKGLTTIMLHNVFRFGDTYWVHLTGTAMGAPPAPMYATLYFGILEQRFLPHYPECLFYNRYIDDGFGVWVSPSDNPISQQNLVRWQAFTTDFNAVSTLQWTFSTLVSTIDFLDLTITIEQANNQVSTRIYEKSLNLYLYLPQQSCHPPGV